MAAYSSCLSDIVSSVRQHGRTIEWIVSAQGKAALRHHYVSRRVTGRDSTPAQTRSPAARDAPSFIAPAPSPRPPRRLLPTRDLLRRIVLSALAVGGLGLGVAAGIVNRSHLLEVVIKSTSETIDR